MKTIDFRSNTATVPTPEMRRVLFEAEVGDDVCGEGNGLEAEVDGALEPIGTVVGSRN